MIYKTTFLVFFALFTLSVSLGKSILEVTVYLEKPDRLTFFYNYTSVYASEPFIEKNGYWDLNIKDTLKFKTVKFYTKSKFSEDLEKFRLDLGMFHDNRIGLKSMVLKLDSVTYKWEAKEIFNSFSFNDGIIIDSLGKEAIWLSTKKNQDPFLSYLGNFEKEKLSGLDSASVLITITADKPEFIKLGYRTDSISYFSPYQNVNFMVNKGYNKILIKLPGLIRGVQFTFGMNKPNSYTLQKLEIRYGDKSKAWDGIEFLESTEVNNYVDAIIHDEQLIFKTQMIGSALIPKIFIYSFEYPADRRRKLYGILLGAILAFPITQLVTKIKV